MDGLTYVLAYEPNELFDAIEKEAAGPVAFTNCLFLFLDGTIVTLAAVGLACFFNLATVVGEGFAALTSG
jgi:hypothetical protein